MKRILADALALLCVPFAALYIVLATYWSNRRYRRFVKSVTAPRGKEPGK
jgi:hypothetical protein